MEGRIAKELYSGVLQSTSVEGIGSTSTQAHQNLHDSELDDLWYDNDDSSRESSVEKLKIPSDMDREWQKRHDQFHTIGYRDGLIAGKEASAQEGFNIGFKDSVSIGYNWGLARGITSAMAFLPVGLKEKMVETEETRNKFQRLHESIHSLSTADALILFHEYLKRKPGNQNEDAAHSYVDADLNNQIRDMDVLQNYFRELLSLVDRDVGDEQLCSVFVPTNHLYIGDILLVNSKDIIRPNLSICEGIEIIVSGGLTMPQTISPIERVARVGERIPLNRLI